MKSLFTSLQDDMSDNVSNDYVLCDIQNNNSTKLRNSIKIICYSKNDYISSSLSQQIVNILQQTSLHDKWSVDYCYKLQNKNSFIAWICVYIYKTTTLIGCCAMMRDYNSDNYMCNMAIIPQHQHKGIGSLLFTYLTEQYGRFWWTVDHDSDATMFYYNLGYRPVYTGITHDNKEVFVYEHIRDLM